MNVQVYVSFRTPVRTMKNESESAAERLLNLGLSMLPQGGVRSLTVRGLCSLAGVSPGTFTGHFGTRAAYIDRLLERWYAPLNEAVSQHHSEAADAFTRMEHELQALVHFFRSNAGTLVQLWLDVAAGETGVETLMNLAEVHHVVWLREAIEAAQREGKIVKQPAEQLMLYLFGAANFPTMIYHMLPKVGQPATMAFVRMFSETQDEAAAMQRLRWALNGIRITA